MKKHTLLKGISSIVNILLRYGEPQSVKCNFNVRYRVIFFPHLNDKRFDLIGIGRDLSSRPMLYKKERARGIGFQFIPERSDQRGECAVCIPKAGGYFMSRPVFCKVHPQGFILFVGHQFRGQKERFWFHDTVY